MNMGMVEFKIEPVLLQKTQIHVVYLSVVLPCILLHSFHTQGCSFHIVKESNKNQNISNITEKKNLLVLTGWHLPSENHYWHMILDHLAVRCNR